MVRPKFRKTNHRAVCGFLLPFLAAGIAAFLVLKGRAAPAAARTWIPFVTLIPLILIVGLVLSIKSLSRIEELGDKDYAYSGLVLNIFFALLYLASVVYYMSL
ncbi:MAG: hypothetical protein JW821_05395 [Deltaproteobacteria bacterium]|nr:hypothetical protein [Deltaproteobacteria bacterium]